MDCYHEMLRIQREFGPIPFLTNQNQDAKQSLWLLLTKSCLNESSKKRKDLLTKIEEASYEKYSVQWV